MALNSKTIQRITKTSTSDVAHSSGYADAQNAGNFGAASSAAQSFEGRLDIENNRKIVQSYRRAMVAQRVNTYDRAKTYEEQLAIEKAKKEAKAAKDQQEKQGFLDCKRKFNIEHEAGGLDRLQREHVNESANLSARQQIKQNMDARQQMAKRFDASARPAPKPGLGLH